MLNGGLAMTKSAAQVGMLVVAEGVGRFTAHFDDEHDDDLERVILAASFAFT